MLNHCQCKIFTMNASANHSLSMYFIWFPYNIHSCNTTPKLCFLKIIIMLLQHITKHKLLLNTVWHYNNLHRHTAVTLSPLGIASIHRKVAVMQQGWFGTFKATCHVDNYCPSYSWELCVISIYPSSHLCKVLSMKRLWIGGGWSNVDTHTQITASVTVGATLSTVKCKKTLFLIVLASQIIHKPTDRDQNKLYSRLFT